MWLGDSNAAASEQLSFVDSHPLLKSIRDPPTCATSPRACTSFVFFLAPSIEVHVTRREGRPSATACSPDDDDDESGYGAIAVKVKTDVKTEEDGGASGASGVAEDEEKGGVDVDGDGGYNRGRSSPNG